MKDLRAFSNKLEARKAEFITAQRIAAEEKSAVAVDMATTSTTQTTAIARIKPRSLPKSYGCKRNFHRWRKDWESLQKQGEKMQLLDSVEGKISRDLHLSTYNTAKDMFRVLGNRYGNKSTTTLEIIEELEKIPAI